MNAPMKSEGAECNCIICVINERMAREWWRGWWWGFTIGTLPSLVELARRVLA